MIITIDGPTASGKSTVARLLAQRLGYEYLNTGLFFRALAYLLVEHEHYSEQQMLNPKETDVKKYLDSQRFKYQCDTTTGATIFFDGKSIQQYLKTSTIDKMASIVGTNPMVHRYVDDMERVG